jgi:hypothetical protein
MMRVLLPVIGAAAGEAVIQLVAGDIVGVGVPPEGDAAGIGGGAGSGKEEGDGKQFGQERVHYKINSDYGNYSSVRAVAGKEPGSFRENAGPGGSPQAAALGLTT